ncbi:LOW QUALITY PROTEIN: cytochrome P450 [Colletotrichum tofieldiae]|nr:LOW QUALITY PROTEIN: cytochrome P450 [Colletotrichum tofieldiae]
MRLLPDDGETADVQPLLQGWFLDIATEFIFSNLMNSPVHPKRSKIADTMLGILDGGRLRAQMHQMMWLRNWDWWLKVVQEHDFVNSLIEGTLRKIDGRDRDVRNGLSAGPGRQDLLWSIAPMENDQESQLYLILVVNIDTTSIFISNCICLGEASTETHRIIPNISQLRDCMNATVVPLGGGPVASHHCLFEREILVLVNKNIMYRNQEYWRDVADIYRPDSFDGHHGSWHFLPFGGRPHRYPAQMMVHTEAGYLLANLAKAYHRIGACDPNHYTPVLRIGPSNKAGVKIALF